MNFGLYVSGFYNSSYIPIFLHKVIHRIYMLISVYYSNPVCQLSQVESSANYGYLTDYYYNAGNLYKQRLSVILLRFTVTVHTPLSREVFWHEYAKIPRHTSQNSFQIVSQIKQITYCIFDNN